MISQGFCNKVLFFQTLKREKSFELKMPMIVLLISLENNYPFSFPTDSNFKDFVMPDYFFNDQLVVCYLSSFNLPLSALFWTARVT